LEESDGDCSKLYLVICQYRFSKSVVLRSVDVPDEVLTEQFL
jgi:hypothetical protein